MTYASFCIIGCTLSAQFNHCFSFVSLLLPRTFDPKPRLELYKVIRGGMGGKWTGQAGHHMWQVPKCWAWKLSSASREVKYGKWQSRKLLCGRKISPRQKFLLLGNLFWEAEENREKSCCHLEWLCPCGEIALPALVMCPDSSLVWFISWKLKVLFLWMFPLTYYIFQGLPSTEHSGHEPQITVPMVYFKDSTCASSMNLKSVHVKTSCCFKVSLWQTNRQHQDWAFCCQPQSWASHAVINGVCFLSLPRQPYKKPRQSAIPEASVWGCVFNHLLKT